MSGKSAADDPGHAKVWVLGVRELVSAWRGARLQGRQLVIPEAEQLDARGTRHDTSDGTRHDTGDRRRDHARA